MKEIYTLLRPAGDYGDDGETTTYAAFLTQEEAESAKKKIIDSWTIIRNKIKEIGDRPVFTSLTFKDNALCMNEFQEWRKNTGEPWDTKAEQIIKSESLFGSCDIYFYDLTNGYNMHEDLIEIRPIPLF